MIIIKIGGAKGVNWDEIAKDLHEICKTEQVIIVHGASRTRDELAEQLNYPIKTVISPSGVSSVFTDERALEIFLMAYPGLVNKQIVAKLQSYAIAAVGLCGVDGRLWEGKRKDKILVKEDRKVRAITGNLTGKVEKINTGLINILFENNYVPVITAPAISYDGEIINTDNDIAVALMAGELNAEKIVMLFDAPGLMKDLDDENSLIREIPREEIANFHEFAKGRMMKKIMGAQKALENGAKEVYFGNINLENPITSALSGQGTVIK